MESAALIYPELSYKIMGAVFDTANVLPFGLPEKDYQKAFASVLEKLKIPFEREVYIPINIAGKHISKYFADFVIDKKILVEFKVIATPGYINARQVLTYLRAGGYKLGILIYFTKDGIKQRRILNSAVSISQ
jgi:GxxExxY protein